MNRQISTSTSDFDSDHFWSTTTTTTTTTSTTTTTTTTMKPSKKISLKHVKFFWQGGKFSAACTMFLKDEESKVFETAESLLFEFLMLSCNIHFPNLSVLASKSDFVADLCEWSTLEKETFVDLNPGQLDGKSYDSHCVTSHLHFL